ncbi:unnamed protein product [Mytilus edulis]|uniref:Uncharacterized protein n=1 Tax=Mytilus edulis TaxID=6550 RepID=A0A8S3PWW6_MYTED|nr:unnamed protein product [Mytilus edulis]
MDCKITNMSDQRENMAQEVEILENTDEETLKWREVGQDSPWIVKDIKDVDTKCGFAKIITLCWKGKNIRTWGCERLNKQLTTVWAKRETDGAVQINAVDSDDIYNVLPFCIAVCDHTERVNLPLESQDGVDVIDNFEVYLIESGEGQRCS